MLAKRYYSWISQLVGLMLMTATIVVIRDLQVGHTWPQWAHAFYLSFEKITYTFGIYLLILPTILEVPNMAFFLLDTKFFNAISKISFWVYLVHFMVVMWVTFEEKVDFYFGTQSIILPIYFSVAAISLFFGFFGTMLIEVPFSKL